MSRYVNDKVGGALVPQDVQGRALMDQWVSVETSNFTPHAMKFIYQYTFHRPQEAAVLEAAGQGLEKALGAMDKQLGKTPFLAGDKLSLADVYFMPYIEYAMGTPAKDVFAKFPHVMAWWNKISERPSWQKAAGRA